MMLIYDDGFSFSDKARRALLCAQKSLQYELVPQNKKTVSDFCNYLLIHLQDCLKHPRKVKCRTLRERIWERYYKFHSSDEFKVYCWICYTFTSEKNKQIKTPAER